MDIIPVNTEEKVKLENSKKHLKDRRSNIKIIAIPKERNKKIEIAQIF